MVSQGCAIAAAVVVAVALVAPAFGQYYYWSNPPQRQYSVVTPGWQHPVTVHRQRQHRSHHTTTTTTHPATRSAEVWKQRIIAQGKQFCRAHPSDSICPHH
jgi:hypothetical protein